MKYKTDLTDAIIKSDKAKELLNMIAPVYGDDYVSLWLFQVIGARLDKVSDWVEEFEKQLVPQTATWSLPIWESEYGLLIDSSLTTEQRRQRIISKMWSNRAMPPAKLAKILENIAGTDIFIEERTGKRKFTVYITSLPKYVDETAVRNRINQLKPSHLVYDIKYQNAVATDMYVGGVIQKFKIINLTEV